METSSLNYNNMFQTINGTPISANTNILDTISRETEEETNNDMKEYDLTKSELEEINNELGKIKPE
jgi:hypothetical protein